jgi:hypothetical protein
MALNRNIEVKAGDVEEILSSRRYPGEPHSNEPFPCDIMY